VNNVVRPTMNKLSTMLFQVVTIEQCCNNMLTILFIVGRTTLFTPVDINLEQVVDFLNFYACTPILRSAVWYFFVFNQVLPRYAELLLSAYLHFAGTIGPQAQGSQICIRNGI
jgi:hypothetical protein